MEFVDQHGLHRGTSPDAVVVFAVGKPPRSGTVVAEVIGRLTRRGVRVDLRLPHDHPDALVFDEPPTLLVHRGLSLDALGRVRDLCTQGVTCCSPPDGAIAVARRDQVTERLHSAGIPVPTTVVTSSWDVVSAAVSESPRFVKAAADTTGRSARVVRVDHVDTDAPFPGPWIVQEAVTHDGLDRKLYVTGREVCGLLKPSMFRSVGGPGTIEASSDLGSPVAFRPSDELVEIALSVGSTLDLHLYGVDVVVGPDGPVVVDVNAFPGYRGVDGAAHHITMHVLDHLTEIGARGPE